MQTQQPPARQPLPAEHLVRLRRLAEQKGVGQAARFIGLAPNTFDRARGGLPMQPGTRALVAAAISKRDQEGKDP